MLIPPDWFPLLRPAAQDGSGSAGKWSDTVLITGVCERLTRPFKR